jgi:hypothetical protein
MSFDIFLQCYRNGEPATFKRSVVKEIFGPHAYGDPDFSNVTFPDGSGSCVYVTDADDIQGMMFNHCGGNDFFQALYKLADRTKSVILWPDTRPSFAITDEATLAHLPLDFEQDFGPGQIVRNGRELQEYIFRKRERRQP